MREKHYEEAYLKERDKCIKLRAFIDSIESQTDYFDEFCDMDCEMSHSPDCMTTLMRKDFEKLTQK